MESKFKFSSGSCIVGNSSELRHELHDVEPALVYFRSMEDEKLKIGQVVDIEKYHSTLVSVMVLAQYGRVPIPKQKDWEYLYKGIPIESIDFEQLNDLFDTFDNKKLPSFTKPKTQFAEPLDQITARKEVSDWFENHNIIETLLEDIRSSCEGVFSIKPETTLQKVTILNDLINLLPYDNSSKTNENT